MHAQAGTNTLRRAKDAEGAPAASCAVQPAFYTLSRCTTQVTTARSNAPLARMAWGGWGSGDAGRRDKEKRTLWD